MSAPALDAAAWAAGALEASRATPVPSTDSPLSREPAHAEALLLACCTDRRAVGERAAPAEPARAEADCSTLLGVGGLLAAYADQVLQPQAVVTALLARAGADGPAPEASLCPIEDAEALAVASAARWRAGTARALEGVPFGIKDIIDVAGARVTCGSRQTGERRATVDATCVARLRAAGGIPLLMLASSEYACGSIHNARYGAVPNPWDRTRWAGGSSTGSGAALAARIVPLALGTDTGGSIRVPAALCGVTGLKPTRGLVPRTGVATLSWTLDHVGPMARSAADIACVLPVLAGPDGADPLAAAHTPGFAVAADITGVRIGVPDGWFVERCDAAVLAAWREALDSLAAAGAALHNVRLPDPALAHEEGWAILYAELAACQEGQLARMDLFDEGTRGRIARGRALHATDYLRALRRRAQIQQAMLDAMNGVDALVMPGVGAEAPRLSDATVEIDGVRASMYDVTPRNTMVFDVTGFPALMMPSGRGRNGLPVAVQVVARPFQDALCLGIGMAFQARTIYHAACPVDGRA